MANGLLRSATYLKDNRLLANGFDKTTALDDNAVVGTAYNDVDFISTNVKLN